jgi:hypothetical protein
MTFKNYVEQDAGIGWKTKAAGVTVLTIALGLSAVPIAASATNTYQFHLTNTAGAGWLIAGASSQKGGGLGFVHAPYSPGYSNCWWDNAQANTQGKIGLSCYAIS